MLRWLSAAELLWLDTFTALSSSATPVHDLSLIQSQGQRQSLGLAVSVEAAAHAWTLAAALLAGSNL